MMKKTKLLLPLLLITLLFSSKSFAYNEKGEYVMGGGVGSIPCKMFLPLYNRAELAGGINSQAGTAIINGYMNYILGFQTGYNSSHLGKKDIFAKFGQAPTNQIFPLIVDWCKENPEKNFGNAVIEIATNANESSEDEDNKLIQNNNSKNKKGKFLFNF